MENLEVILSIAGTAAGLLVTALTFLLKLIKAIKERNFQEAANILRTAAQEAVQFVEDVKTKTNGDLDGETKKTMALIRVNQACIEKGIKFNAEEASRVIEELVALTKVVNAH